MPDWRSCLRLGVTDAKRVQTKIRQLADALQLNIQ
jgi:hypothetical protein